MGKFLVEFNGSLRTVNVEMLRQLLQRRFVTMDTRLLIDGREGRVGDIADQLCGTESAQPSFPDESELPKEDAPIAPPPFANDVQVPVPPRVSAPDANEFQENDGMIALDDFLGSSEDGENGTSKSKKVIICLVIAFVVSVITYAVVFIILKSTLHQKPDLESANEYADISDISVPDFSESIGSIEEETHDKEEASGDVFCNEPFDDSITSIPKGFKGCDFVALYNKLDGLFVEIEKDEYETTQEFEKRRENLLNETLQNRVLGTITPESRVVASVDYFYKKYDADSATIDITVFRLNDDSSCQLISHSEDRKYIGENGYGVEVEVKETTYTEYGVFVSDDCDAKYGFKFKLKASPDEARNLKDHISALLVFTITPYKSKYSTYYKATDFKYSRSKPTTTLPYEDIRLQHFVYGKEVEVWFYNAETGEILLKERISGKKQEYPSSETSSLPEKAFDSVFGQSNNSFSNNSYPNNRYQNNGRQNYEPEEEEWDYPETLDETDEPASKKRGDKPGKKKVVEEVPPPKTWQQLVAESVDEVANWEKKKPTLIVPGDYDTLAEAVEKANSGDVIQLKKNSPSSYSLGVKPGAERLGVVIDKPLAIVGETGEASDVVVKVGVNESIFVEAKGAMFKGITFQCGPLGTEKTYEPIVKVSGSGWATFKYCRFLGDGIERSVGVQVEGDKAKAEFWKCEFLTFGNAGLFTKGGGRATLRYCQFLEKNHYGLLAQFDSFALLERCRFLDNDVGFHAETGGGCRIEESQFERNDHRAEISPASRNKVEETNNVYDRK